jgi:hypothetical protein
MDRPEAAGEDPAVETRHGRQRRTHPTVVCHQALCCLPSSLSYVKRSDHSYPASALQKQVHSVWLWHFETRNPSRTMIPIGLDTRRVEDHSGSRIEVLSLRSGPFEAAFIEVSTCWCYRVANRFTTLGDRLDLSCRRLALWGRLDLRSSFFWARFVLSYPRLGLELGDRFDLGYHRL